MRQYSLRTLILVTFLGGPLLAAAWSVRGPAVVVIREVTRFALMIGSLAVTVALFVALHRLFFEGISYLGRALSNAGARLVAGLDIVPPQPAPDEQLRPEAFAKHRKEAER
jgi:hypothetical protein